MNQKQPGLQNITGNELRQNSLNSSIIGSNQQNQQTIQTGPSTNNQILPQGNLGSYIQVGKSIGSNKIGNGQTISSSQGTQQQTNAQAIIQQTNNISSSANTNQNNINLRNLRNPLKAAPQILGNINQVNTGFVGSIVNINNSNQNGLNSQQHRKSNSISVNNQAALLSAKNQINGTGQLNVNGIANMKFVKPSELSLDLITPSNLRNLGIKGSHPNNNSSNNQAVGIQQNSNGLNTSSNSNQNMQNILQNFRTPQNLSNSNQQLSMYGNQGQVTSSIKSPKELPGIIVASSQHGSPGNNIHQSNQNQQNQINEMLAASQQNSYQLKKRNASGNHRNVINMNNQSLAAQFIHGSQTNQGSINPGISSGQNTLLNSNDLTPSKGVSRKINIIQNQNGIAGGFHHGALNNFGINSGNSTLASSQQVQGASNSKTPKEAYKRIQGIVAGGHVHHHSHTDSRVADPSQNDRLNLSVDIIGRQNNINQSVAPQASNLLERQAAIERLERPDRHSSHPNAPQINQISLNQLNTNAQNSRLVQKMNNARDFQKQKGVNRNRELNNSVHDFINKKGAQNGERQEMSINELSVNHKDSGQAGSNVQNHNHSKSLIKNGIGQNDFMFEELSLNMPADKKKEILDKKRNEQIQKSYNLQQASSKSGGISQIMPSVTGPGSLQIQDTDQGQSGDLNENGPKLESGVQLNLENLTKIDEKFQQLIDQLRVQKVNNISQLCSDWWELTDEDDYSIAKFEKAIKDDKVRRELRIQMTLEILSIAVVNYYTSAPDVLKPTHLQIQSVKNLLNFIQQNFLGAVEIIIARLPNDLLQNNFANQLQNILKQKRGKKQKPQKDQVPQNQMNVRQMNEQIISILKGIIRQGQQAGAGANMSAKRLLQMRNQGLLKSSMVTGAALRPLYVVINRTLKNLESSTLNQVRNNIIKASEEIEKFKQYANLPPLYGVGGTAIGGYEPLPTPDPPYLPEIEGGTGYCLVLDLDETLVHYFEVGSEGTFLVRPGCDQFLTEMAEIYEVVIFTAAMQDYADWVLNQIDKQKRIKYRLYRQHALPHGPVFVKDLSRIGRDLSKTIIVDNVAENFQLQPDNGIFIKSWFDDMNDTALSELAPLLKQIVKKQVPDVRDALRRFRDQMLDQIAKGVTNPQLSLD